MMKEWNASKFESYHLTSQQSQSHIINLSVGLSDNGLRPDV
jgi:hypothetical protein